MSIYGEIGITRRDKTPQHWRRDYRLKATAKKMLAQISAERERLFRELESLPDDISDEEYDSRSREIATKLDDLIERADEIRRKNP
ncbi:hypothetical protein [Paenibacillus barengoltzii]|uniref:hypothetical protein n=1 Tax=Paenibacillus barengoltzii TaxID=343517 RepID=UPI000FDC01AE|nr:hypothetical protein [Paenibacillus barengoltzii]